MEKKLFTQIRNEWHSNLWLALELLVVSVVMWYIIDLLYCRLATYMEPRGFDTEHCYLITMGVLTDKSPDYTPYSDTHKQTDEVRELVERLRRRPEVEAVSLSQRFCGSGLRHASCAPLDHPPHCDARLCTRVPLQGGAWRDARAAG